MYYRNYRKWRLCSCFYKALVGLFLRAPHSYTPAFCVFSATSTTEQENHNFCLSGLGPKYFNPSLILSKKNTVKHPGLQETDKTFFSEGFTGGEVTLCVCSVKRNLIIFNAMFL